MKIVVTLPKTFFFGKVTTIYDPSTTSQGYPRMLLNLRCKFRSNHLHFMCFLMLRNSFLTLPFWFGHLWGFLTGKTRVDILWFHDLRSLAADTHESGSSLFALRIETFQRSYKTLFAKYHLLGFCGHLVFWHHGINSSNQQLRLSAGKIQNSVP